MKALLPSRFIGDRIFLCPTTKDGIKLTFWTDTGGPAFIKSETVRRLGMTSEKQVFPEGEFDVVPYPEFAVGESIPTGSRVKSLVVRDDPRPDIDGMLGMPWFADKVWIIDYLNAQFWHVDGEHEETPMDDHVCKLGFVTDGNGVRQISFPRIQATVDHRNIDFLFDTGATLPLSDAIFRYIDDGMPQVRATSFIVSSIFDEWRTSHPDWIVIEGADAYLNESIIRVPIVSIAGNQIGPVWFTRRSDQSFQSFSQWMDRPISGALGGNVFKHFSVLIDYPRGFAYFAPNNGVVAFSCN